MLCSLCHKFEVQDLNPKITICDLCRIELEMSFNYFIGGKEITKEEYERQINEHREWEERSYRFDERRDEREDNDN